MSWGASTKVCFVYRKSLRTTSPWYLFSVPMSTPVYKPHLPPNFTMPDQSSHSDIYSPHTSTDISTTHLTPHTPHLPTKPPSQCATTSFTDTTAAAIPSRWTSSAALTPIPQAKTASAAPGVGGMVARSSEAARLVSSELPRPRRK